MADNAISNYQSIMGEKNINNDFNSLYEEITDLQNKIAETSTPYDSSDATNEFVEKKLQAISQFVLPEDTMGIVDRAKLIRKKLQVIDPSLADELVVENAEASQAMFEEVNSQVAFMALGNNPSKLVENDPSAAIKLQFLQQIIQNNPKYQQQLQADEQFAELLKVYSQNLNMSVMQQNNKQVGRLGVNPNA